MFQSLGPSSGLNINIESFQNGARERATTSNIPLLTRIRGTVVTETSSTTRKPGHNKTHNCVDKDSSPLTRDNYTTFHI
jgi:hypothetical protein